MDVGLVYFPTEYTIAPGVLAILAEQRGFESLFVCEHTHIPASRATPWPGGADLPRDYWHTYDPFVALTSAAAVTTRLKVGTGICLVVERDPITTAKEVASLDHLSGGRFLFGVGAGWNVEEMANHGTDPARRFSLLRERIEAMKAIWTEDEAEYHGEHVDFDPIWSSPKPAQKPHPPILVGGGGEKVFDRVIAYGDEWFPIRFGSPDLLRERIAALQSRAADAGRGPIGVTLFGAAPDVSILERLRDAGVTRALFGTPSAAPDEVERLVDEWAGVLREFRGT